MQAPFKDPSLKLRYARGLGDIVACILHSKLLSWLTKAITGKSKPCSMCATRQQALNILLPIPLWKLFFSSPEKASEAYAQDYTNAGHTAQVSKFNNGQHILTAEQLPVSPDNSSKVPAHSLSSKYEPALIDSKLSAYILTSISESEHDHILIRTHIYKKK